MRTHIAIMLLLISSHADAHNSWVVVDRHAAAPGETVRMAFVTAHDTFPLSEHAAAPERVAEWLVVRGRERRRITGFAVEGQELVALHSIAQPGAHVVAVALHPRFIELTAEEFRGYLEEERAESALASLASGGATSGREIYTKLAKTFVSAGDSIEPTEPPAWAAPVGHTLEIVPLSDPTRWRAGSDVEVQVLLRGKPAAGVHVSSGNQARGGHDYVQTVKTDERGRATLRLSAAGHWFLRTHSMRAAPAGTTGLDGQSAEWESFFASITVRVAD